MNRRILICDDEAHIRRAVELKLSRAGFEVEASRDGEEAWESLQQAAPDLLITDLQMPRLDGLALCERIAGDDRFDFPIIMLTAKGFEFDAQEVAENYHVDIVIDKPFSPRELAGIVENLLGDDASESQSVAEFAT